MNKVVTDVVDRMADWPDEAQAELLSIAIEMDAEIKRGVYVPTPAELAGIDRGIAAADRGEIVGLDEIERLFEKHRPK